MSNGLDDWLKDDIDIESTLTAKMVEQAKPLTLNVDARPRPTNWLTIALMCAVMFFAGMQLRSCKPDFTPGPTPDDDTLVIDDKGNFVMILRDNSEPGQSALTPGQAQAITSTKVSSWCRSNGFDFRIIDSAFTDQQLAAMEPIWGTLRKQAAAAPSLTAAKDGKAFTRQLPDGIDATIQALEAIK